MFRDDTRWKQYGEVADNRGHGLISETLVCRYDKCVRVSWDYVEM
jgi:hypothetical protein